MPVSSSQHQPSLSAAARDDSLRTRMMSSVAGSQSVGLELDGMVASASVPAFSLDDSSDSDDSLHQFLRGGHKLGSRHGDSSGDSDDEDNEDEVFLKLGSASGAGIGSPYGAGGSSRPPSPRRPITVRPIRAATSEPSAGVASAAAVSPSVQRRHRKKRQTQESSIKLSLTDSEDDDVENFCKASVAIASESASLVSVKRRRLTPSVPLPRPLVDASNRRGTLARCMSEQQCCSSAVTMDTVRIDKAIASIDSLNLIGNSEQGHSLPTVKELDFGIRYVTSETVSRLLAGHFADRVPEYEIVDCRYPYEFKGGHIRGAVNLYRPEDLLERMLRPSGEVGQISGGRVVIFHCEFSSERAPRMARLLRQRDREINSHNYPQLHYPELYLLQGGYKAFYEAHKVDCEPITYTRMADPEYKDELAHFHRLSKAWERQNSRSKHSRLQKLAGSPMLM